MRPPQTDAIPVCHGAPMPKLPLQPLIAKAFVCAAVAYGLMEWLALTRSRWSDRGRARQRSFTGP